MIPQPRGRGSSSVHTLPATFCAVQAGCILCLRQRVRLILLCS
jgi:hypothetical protein